jgi:hypothetical protein
MQLAHQEWARRWVRSPRVLTSLVPIRRLYPSTSAAKIATNRRSVSIGFAKIGPLIRLAAYRGTRWDDTTKIEANPVIPGNASMSELGQTRKSAVVFARSVLPPTTDIVSRIGYVEKVPGTDIAPPRNPRWA